MVLMEQRAKTLQCWFEPFVRLRAPKLFNLRRDPFEQADENSNTYWGWGDLSRLYCISNAGHCSCANRELQKISTAPKAGLVQLGRRDENAGGRKRRGKPLTAPEHL